ncbi:MAG: beta-propeller fold lactonase family protein [Acidobacteria bacterium]|nr:beta-propeller fold lactonase family protein [Acidobacteriota bacterium]
MIFQKTKNARRCSLGVLLLVSFLLTDCGGGGGSSSPSTPPSPAVVSLTVASATALVPPGKNQTFSATVTGSANTSVTWSVVEVNGGSITASGIYTAPLTLGTYHLIATSVADSTKSATITVTVPQYPRFAYVANANDSTISIYTVDPVTGILRPDGYYYIGLSTQPESLAIDPTGSYLYVADYTGSRVWAYSINPPSNINKTGKLTFIGNVSSAGGPTSLTVDPSGKYVYVANLNGGVTAYTIGGSGALTAISGSPFTAGTNPDGVVVDPSGKYLYVSNLGGGVSAYTITGTGSLSPIAGTAPTGTNPEAVVVDPSGKFLYVANNDGTLSSFSITGTGSLSPIGSITVSSSLDSITIDPSGRYIYLTDSVTNQIYAYSINSTTGALAAVTGSPFATGTTPQFVSVDSSGQFLYVANRGSNDVWEYSINTDTGGLTQSGTMRSRSGSYALALIQGSAPVTFIPKFAYTADFATSTVYAFSINSNSGALTNVPSPNTRATGSSPAAIAADPSGQYVFVANRTSNTISAYTIDPVTGVLTESSYSPFSTDLGPQALTVDPSGRFLYVANQSSNSVTIFPVQQIFNGPSPMTPVVQSIGGAPQAVSIDSTGLFLYVGFIATGTLDVNVYQIDSNSGGLTLVSGSPFGSGSNPYSIAVDPTGRFAYVTDSVLNQVAGFSISSPANGTPGALTPLIPATFGTGSIPTVIIINPAGQFAFVTSSGSNYITTYAIDPVTGLFGVNGYYYLNLDDNPYGISIDISGRFAYVANKGRGWITAHAIDPLTGILGSPLYISGGTSPRSIVATGAVQ